jgi:Ca2+-transporting ATPase
MTTTVHGDGRQSERALVLTRGAPDVLLARCNSIMVGEAPQPFTSEQRGEIARANERLAAQALRTLAMAGREVPRERFRRMPSTRVSSAISSSSVWWA